MKSSVVEIHCGAWWRYVLYRWVAKYYGDFLGPRRIFGKIFIKIVSSCLFLVKFYEDIVSSYYCGAWLRYLLNR